MQVVSSSVAMVPQSNLRRFARFRVEFAVRLKSQSGIRHLVTANVSRNGLFIRCDSAPAERQLIQFSVDLGPHGIIDVVGMVVHSFAPGHPHPDAPGMGVEYFAMSKDDKKTWDRFCIDQDKKMKTEAQVRESGDLPVIEAMPLLSAPSNRLAVPPQAQTHLAAPHSESPHTAPSNGAPRLVSLDVVPHVRRKNKRFAAIFEARLRDQEQIKKFFTCDIGMGGTFLRSEKLLATGSCIELVLVHPRTHNEFELAATVVRVSQGGSKTTRGMGVKFADMSEHTRSEFEQFVMSGVKVQDALPVDTEEIVLLDDILEFDAKTPRAHTNIARIYIEQLEDPPAAVVELNQALIVSPDYLPAHRLLCLAYALCGDKGNAYEHIREVMRLRGGEGVVD